MITYLRLEVLRTLSDKRFLILMTAMPVAMYLLFTNLFGAQQPSSADTLTANVGAMVSMAAFGAIGAALSATAPRIAQERTNGWLRQLRTMPIRTRDVITAKVLAAMLVAVPAIVLVDVAAVINHGVHLAVWQWLGIGVCLWTGTATFAALGTLIGFLTEGDSAFGIMYGIYLFLGAVGGLWMPPSVLPSVLQDISRFLPSNHLARLGWTIAAGHAPHLGDGAIVAAWLILFAAMAAVRYRRPAAVR
jgi:ABC-2 type transport system permease protein